MWNSAKDTSAVSLSSFLLLEDAALGQMQPMSADKENHDEQSVMTTTENKNILSTKCV